MLTFLTYVCAEADGSARCNFYLTKNCSDNDSHLVSCDNCAGEGGFYQEENAHSLEGFALCPACGGSGYVEGEPPSLTLSDLEERSP